MANGARRMNIFYLDRNPKIAAQMHCDKHVVKMVLEYAQILSTAHRVIDGDEAADRESLYKIAHKNHPSTAWARASHSNYSWLSDLWAYLGDEYTYRYGKVHKSEAVIQECMDQCRDLSLYNLKRTPHPLCMPDQYKTDDAVESYRRFYIGEKASFARWNKTTEPPPWWPEGDSR